MAPRGGHILAMQLSPLQSRLAASVVASCLLIILYLTLFTPHFAVALELEESSPVFFDDLDFAPNPAPQSPANLDYEPDFAPFDRSILGRAPTGVTGLANNEAIPMNVIAGTTQLFMFTVSSSNGREAAEGPLELRSEQSASQTPGDSTEVDESNPAPNNQDEHSIEKRQSSRRVYISANTCKQPQPVGPVRTTQQAPQLTLYVSTSPSNPSPGPMASADSQTVVEFTEGAVMYDMTARGDVYIGVSAPNVSKEFQGAYNFRIAVSTDMYFYSYNAENDAALNWVDSDAQGALLITHNLTRSSNPRLQQKIMAEKPYVIFAQNTNDSSINGLKLSYCGLQNYAQIAATKSGQFASMVETGMTKRGQGHLPKQQFYFSGLNSSSNYVGILAREGNSTASGNGVAGGGGHVIRATNFSTKSSKSSTPPNRLLTTC